MAKVDFSLERASRFSYVCNACKRCCYGKAIRVGPYEALRLARRLGLTTTEFFARHTEAGGTVLKTREDRSCVFLDEHGCSVHPDRPLACRIYPLARWVDPYGNESFGHLTPHPQTAGVYGDKGTVADYLAAQGLAPYFAMGDRYGAVYERMVGLLERLAPAESERRAERRAEVDEMDAGAVATSFFDVDATVADYCRVRNLAVPTEVDALIDLHLSAIGAWLDELEARLQQGQ
ncbi:MAG TPA: YkgJ family cysteine cluster protein [Gaiellaceae bacterium]|nr:YkgJ family cysteine cluster protein [Gaiellaceae bacterium]